jgi:hypothetical protein
MQLFQNDFAAGTVSVGKKREKDTRHPAAPDLGDQTVVT